MDATWFAYLSMDSAIVVQRARSLLDLPVDAAVWLNGDRLIVDGPIDDALAERLTDRVPGIAGVGSVVLTSASRLRLVVDRIERERPRYLSGTDRFEPGQDAVLDRMTEDLEELAVLLSSTGSTAVIHVRGDADATGSSVRNVELSRLRAERFRAEIVPRLTRALNSGLLAIETRGLEPDGEPLAAGDRAVSLRIELTTNRD